MFGPTPQRRGTWRWLGLGLTALYAGACAAQAQPQPQMAPAAGPSRGELRMFRSDKPIAEKGGRTLPLWLVDTRVEWPTAKGGASTFAIVDTGARTTLIDRRFALAHGLPVVSSNVVAKDFAGKKLDTSVIHQVTLGIGPWTSRPVNVIVVELPSLFRDLGIGVIWSPQTSVPKGTMLRFNFGAGTAAMEPDTGMAANAALLCKGEEGPVPSAATIVSVLVANQPVRLELDSGATKLGLSGASALAKALQQAPGATAGERVGAGGAERTLEVPPQELKLAGQTYVAAVSMTSNADPSPGACSSDGEIGLEVLQNCMVDISADRFGVRCAAARQPAAP